LAASDSPVRAGSACCVEEIVEESAGDKEVFGVGVVHCPVLIVDASSSGSEGGIQGGESGRLNREYRERRGRGRGHRIRVAK
jgi:hypothetical protein